MPLVSSAQPSDASNNVRLPLYAPTSQTVAAAVAASAAGFLNGSSFEQHLADVSKGGIAGAAAIHSLTVDHLDQKSFADQDDAAGRSGRRSSESAGGGALALSSTFLCNEEDNSQASSISSAGNGEDTETAPEAEHEDDSVTRCICNFLHDDGYMICCDKCL